MVDQWEPVSRDSVKTPLEVLPLETHLRFGKQKCSTSFLKKLLKPIPIV